MSGAPPKVPDLRRADFTKGDDLPDGAVLVDGGGNASGLALTPRGLTHGQPTTGNLAAGVLEVKLDSDVRSLGFRVAFPDKDPGSVSLVGWQSSIAATVESGSDQPPSTGFRLVAAPGEWTLSVLDGDEDVIAEGTYGITPGAATFQILRDRSRVFVIDPSGATTEASDARVADLAGPWASWGLTESSADQSPATIEAVWGG